MALIKCPECSKEISSKAPACPGCGTPIKPPKKQTSMVTWLVLFFIVVGVVTSISGKRGAAKDAEARATAEQQRVASLTPEQRAAEAKANAEKAAVVAKQEKMDNARYACQEFVKRSLNDPASAEFERHRTFWAEEAKDGSFNVQVRVRAKNGFNALVSSVFECKTRLVGSDWVAVKINQMKL